MDCCCSKFDPQNIGKFEAPADIWELQMGEGQINNDLGKLLLRSVSGYALTVIGNVHNMVMSSKDYSFYSKLCIVIGLSLASLAVSIFACVETVARLVLVAIVVPLDFASRYGCGYPILNRPPCELVTYAYVQIPLALAFPIGLAFAERNLSARNEATSLGREHYEFCCCE